MDEIEYLPDTATSHTFKVWHYLRVQLAHRRKILEKNHFKPNHLFYQRAFISLIYKLHKDTFVNRVHTIRRYLSFNSSAIRRPAKGNE